MGSHQRMVGQHYQVMLLRDQTNNQLRAELAVAQSQLQNLSNAESVEKHLTEEMNIAKTQITSLESSSQKDGTQFENGFRAKGTVSPKDIGVRCTGPCSFDHFPGK